MYRVQLTDKKFCIDRISPFSTKLSDHFERGNTLSFEELWRNREELGLKDSEKTNYDIIQFSFVMLNCEGKPLYIERQKEAHHITTGISILQSCSPGSIHGSFPRSISDIKFYFEQEVETTKHQKPSDYEIDLLGIAKNVRKGINYYFYIFRVKFSVKNPKLLLRKDPDKVLSLDDSNSKFQSLKDKKVDLRVLKVLFPQFELPPEEVKGCSLHEEVNNSFCNVLFTTRELPIIQTVHISETEQDIVRIAVAQISFDLTESFPFAVRNRDEVKTKVFSALEIAKRDGANIVCLPELCLCEEWISEIEEQCPNMIVIGGSFYKDNQNTCPVIMESDAVIPYQPKITPAATEYGMIPGDQIYRYETKFGKFVILICTDFDNLAHYFREADIDTIFCPSFNSSNERFWNEAHSHVERTPSYILIANTGLHGGTSIFGQLDDKYFGALVDGGCKDAKEVEDKKWTCKLCEVKKGCEEVILADFNLIHKSVQKPMPSNQSKVIKSVDHIRKIPILPDRPMSKLETE